MTFDAKDLPRGFAFRDALRRRRLAMGAGNRKKNPRVSTRGKTWLYPAALERKYRRAITLYLEPLVERAQEWLKLRLPLLLAQSAADRRDAFTDDLEALIQLLHSTQQELFEGGGRGNLFAVLQDLAGDVQNFNQAQMQKFMELALGTSFFADEVWVADAIRVWATDNFTLIKGLGEEFVKRINLSVSGGVQSGATAQSIMADIRNISSFISKSRAALIARDQVGKLQGTFTRSRQRNAGIDMYIWETAHDERVRGRPGGKYAKARPSHWAMQGKLCRWDNNAVYSRDGGKTWVARTPEMPRAIPGSEIQCRCTALPYFDDLVNVVDAEIEESQS